MKPLCQRSAARGPADASAMPAWGWVTVRVSMLDGPTGRPSNWVDKTMWELPRP
jgi:hypothetical protein